MQIISFIRKIVLYEIIKWLELYQKLYKKFKKNEIKIEKILIIYYYLSNGLILFEWIDLKILFFHFSFSYINEIKEIKSI